MRPSVMEQRICLVDSLVISASRQNTFRAVQLFQHHHPAEMMGEGHGADAKPEIPLCFQGAVDPKRGPHQEYQLRFSAQTHLIQLRRQLLRG